MLDKSLSLNFSLTKSFIEKLKLSQLATFIFLATCYISYVEHPMEMFAAVVAALGTGVSACILIGVCHRIFHQSLFDEAAYTYMQFPLSSSAVVKGKLLTVLYAMIWNALIFSTMWLFVYLWWRDLNEGVVPWDLYVVETLVEDLHRVGEVLYGQTFSSKATAVFLGSFVLQIVLACTLLCSGVQLGTILNHVYNRGGRKRYMPVLLMAAGLAIAVGCVYLPTKIFCIVSSGMITVSPIVITMVLEIALIIAAVRWSIRLLQTKYELN